MVIWMMRMMDGEDGDDLTVEPVPVRLFVIAHWVSACMGVPYEGV